MQKITRKPVIRNQRGAWAFRLFAAASALLALSVLLTPCLMRAQLATADILGTVTDSTGAVVPNAKVTIVNTGTGIASSTNTDKVGEYLFSHVQIGTFKVTVEAKGFRSFTVTDLATTAGQRVRVAAKLEVGSQVETVQVEATAAAQLQTDSSDINATIENNTIDEMPTNGRNYYSLIGIQVAGASSGGGGGGPTDSRPSMGFTANGQSGTYNNNMIDGMDNNERSLGSVAVEPSLDALQEVQVEVSNYSAEYSRTAGGIANLITKSGTNHFHGTAFEFMRNDDFDAYAWALPGQATKAELRQNQFGGSLGGPILKNKAFFFGDYQGWRLVNGAVHTFLVPTLDEYTAIHALSTGAANSITFNDQWDNWDGAGSGVTVYEDQVNPFGLAMLMEAPKPNPTCTGTVNGFANLCGNTYNWFGAENNLQQANTYDGRVDYHVSDKNTFFGRFSYNKTVSDTPGGMPATTILNGNSHTYAPHYSVNPVITSNVALDYVHIFSPKTLFEAKASYLRMNETSYTSGTTYWTMETLGFPCDSSYCYNSSGVPGLPAAGMTNTSTDSSVTPYTNVGSKSSHYGYTGDEGLQGYIENTYQYNAALTLNRKNHSIKMGVGFIRRQVNAPADSSDQITFSANYTGNALADLLEGYSSAVTGQKIMVEHRGRMWEPSAYIQDDWRATKALTLNLGVRYDIYTPFTDRYGNLSNFNLNTDLLVSPNLLGNFSSSPTGNIATDFSDVSPRFGFAYSFGNSNTLLKNLVLRGGYGISYFPTNAGTEGGLHEFELLNAPFIWSMGCGNPAYSSSAACGPSNAYIPSSETHLYWLDQQGNNTLGGGYNLEYGLPLAQYDTGLATNTSLYTSSMDSAVFIMPSYKPGYLQQFNLQLQKQVGNNIVTVGFVGNVGRRLPSMQNINQKTSQMVNGTATHYPLYGSSATWMDHVQVGEVISGGNSTWEGGEATYERRLSFGLSADVNYTWARTEAQGTGTSECVLSGCLMDNGSGTAVVVNGWQRYNYDGSTSHRAAGMVSYDLPFGKSLHGPLGAAVKGWALNGTGSWNTGAWGQVVSGDPQSGLALTSGVSGASSANEYPNRVPGVSVKPHHQSLGNWINPAAFKLQAAGLMGNANKSDVQLPRVRQADLGLGKTFSLLEGFKLQFRAEAFNFTNTPSYSTQSAGGGPPPMPGQVSGTLGINFYDPITGLAQTTGGFGSITNATANPRVFQFGLKLLY